jgi:hypothetical protein
MYAMPAHRIIVARWAITDLSVVVAGPGGAVRGPPVARHQRAEPVDHIGR